MGASQKGICSRVAQIRYRVAGRRGKSTFARMLGLSPSTYDYYEANRTPPAPVLVKMARVADVDLCWLLTGESSERREHHNPAVQRAADLIAETPPAADALGAFVELLEKSLKLPRRTDTRTGPAKVDRDHWVPVLGRSAAGIPHFWADEADASEITSLWSLARRAATQKSVPAEGRYHVPVEEDAVEVITLTCPEADEPSQFIAAPAMKQKHPDAFALQIDGESMGPEFRHGDLILCSPDAPAANGKPAIVQLRGQIGVTCKLYRRNGAEVHLIPVNDQFAPMTCSAEDVVWSLRVLGRVRV